MFKVHAIEYDSRPMPVWRLIVLAGMLKVRSASMVPAL